LSELLSVSEALQQLLGEFQPVDAYQTPLVSAAGRVLAEKINAIIDLPPFTNSSMDGFAVYTEDVIDANPQKPIILEVIEDIPAGQVAHERTRRGQAARIMTGASLPGDADAVVPVENTDFNYRQSGIPAPSRVKVFHSVKKGENIRWQGQDILAGTPILTPGVRLRPQDIGLLAMMGIEQVYIFRKPRIAILSTGDELIPVNEPLQPGKIHDANADMLSALVTLYGTERINLGIASDHFSSIKSCLDRAVAERVDLILSSAGVSVGAFDYVRSVVEKYGQINFWRVNVRPGKPLAYGRYQNIPLIGLPGNPVSAFISFEVFVRPVILKLSGISNWTRHSRKVQLLESIESDGRESYLRAIVINQDGHLQARLTGHQGSGNLLSIVQANALLIIPSEVKSLPIGTEVDAWIYNDMGNY
jgi:molybdopterin molybdotransferase